MGGEGVEHPLRESGEEGGAGVRCYGSKGFGSEAHEGSHGEAGRKLVVVNHSGGEDDRPTKICIQNIGISECENVRMSEYRNVRMSEYRNVRM